MQNRNIRRIAAITTLAVATILVFGACDDDSLTVSERSEEPDSPQNGRPYADGLPDIGSREVVRRSPDGKWSVTLVRVSRPDRLGDFEVLVEGPTCEIDIAKELESAFPIVFHSDSQRLLVEIQPLGNYAPGLAILDLNSCQLSPQLTNRGLTSEQRRSNPDLYFELPLFRAAYPTRWDDDVLIYMASKRGGLRAGEISKQLITVDLRTGEVTRGPL